VFMSKEEGGGTLVEKARASLVNKRVFVHLDDGRTVQGFLTCLDKQGNIILSNAVEGEPKRLIELEGGREKVEVKARTRQVGTVLIPRELRVSCHAEVLAEDLLDLKLHL